MLKFRCGLY